jgi:hypothetical protein
MEGVERLFERIVREHQHRVFAVGFALTGNRHDSANENLSAGVFVVGLAQTRDWSS